MIVREPGLPQRYTVQLEPVEVVTTGDREHDVRTIVSAYTKKLEDRIREHPEQYFWHHRRWKSRPALPVPPTAPAEEPPHEADVLQVDSDGGDGPRTGGWRGEATREPLR